MWCESDIQIHKKIVHERIVTIVLMTSSCNLMLAVQITKMTISLGLCHDSYCNFCCCCFCYFLFLFNFNFSVIVSYHRLTRHKITKIQIYFSRFWRKREKNTLAATWFFFVCFTVQCSICLFRFYFLKNWNEMKWRKNSQNERFKPNIRITRLPTVTGINQMNVHRICMLYITILLYYKI